MDKPIASLTTLADYMINGYWLEVSDQNGLGYPPHKYDHKVITYSFAGLDGPSAQAQQDMALLAMRMWSEVADIQFVEANPFSFHADIYFHNQGDGKAANTPLTFEVLPGGGLRLYSASVGVTKDFFADAGSGPGSKGLQTYVHEIAHALGLGHTGPYNVGVPTENYNPTYQADAVYANDTRQYSVMSYFDPSNYGAVSDGLPSTPQMADILAIQTLYGAALTRPGNTTYLAPGANAGTPFDLSAYAFVPALTIYDSDGVDTLDVSTFNNDQIVNLEPGAWSSVAGFKNNVGIWVLTIIENAFGGGGRDVLRGNGVDNLLDGGGAGDTLYGLGGNDYLLGWGGDDSIVGGNDDDTLEGGPGADTLDGEGGSDTASYLFSTAPVIARLWLGQGFQNDAEGDRYLGIQNLLGSFAGDELAGDDGDNRLDGSFGNDTLIGGPGADELIGGPGDDTADFGDSDAAVKVFLLFGVALGGSAQGDTLSEIETVRGSVHGDSLFGDTTDNRLEGRDGNDSLFGDAGWDTLDGGQGRDRLDGGEGFDRLEGGADDDTYLLEDVTYRRVTTPSGLMFEEWVYDDVREAAGEGIDNVQVRRVPFGPHGYTLPDDIETANILGSENFDLTGNALPNQLVGNSGVNGLEGGEGADTLKGGGGDDWLTGGPGPDVYIYLRGDGTDTITDFDKEGGDRLDVSGVPGVHGIDDIPLAQQGPNTVITFGSGFVLLNVQASTLTAAQFIFNQPPSSVHLSPASVDENSAAGTLVGTLSADDPDAGDSVSFSLRDDAGGRFELDGLQIKVRGALDHEAAATHTIVVRATDAWGNVFDASLLVSVDDVNEAPTGVALSPDHVAEGAPGGTVVGQLTAQDPDASDTFSWTLEDAAGGRFALVGDQIVLVAELDHEAAAQHTIQVRVNDAGGLGHTESIIIRVDDVNERPTDIALGGTQVLENSPFGTEIGRLTAADPDVGDVLTFSLIDSAGGRVALSNDRLVVAGAIDFEQTPTLTVAVRVTDRGGLSYDETFALGVGNVPGVTIIGGAGADRIQRDRSAPGQPRPTDEEDLILGGEGSDRIDALGGNDTVFGGPGADWLHGGAGDDVLWGGIGADRFQFGPGFGHDRIGDFIVKGGHDFIVFDRTVFADAAAVLAASRQQGSDVIIEDAGGNSLTLVGVALGALQPSHFDFTG